jgi:hypothetical protein
MPTLPDPYLEARPVCSALAVQTAAGLEELRHGAGICAHRPPGLDRAILVIFVDGQSQFCFWECLLVQLGQVIFLECGRTGLRCWRRWRYGDRRGRWRLGYARP